MLVTITTKIFLLTFWSQNSEFARRHSDHHSLPGPAQDFHIQHVHLQDRLRPATQTVAATIGLHNQRISAQTVRNRLREAHLHARRPHRGLDLTPVRCRNRLEWANAHIRWRLARWRGVLFTDESRFSLFRADGRQRVWRRVDTVNEFSEAHCCAIHPRPSPHVAA